MRVTDLLMDALGELAPAAMLTLVLMAFARFRSAWVPMLVAGLFMADALALGVGSWMPELRIAGASWNWLGKGMGMAIASLLLLPRSMRVDVGLFRLPQRRHLAALTGLAASVVALAVGRTLAFGKHAAFDLETVAY